MNVNITKYIFQAAKDARRDTDINKKVRKFGRTMKYETI